MAANSSSDNHYDYIIVGAGSAGCALAYKLSREASRRVLLLEAGGKDLHPAIHMPLGFAVLMKEPRVNWLYESEPEPNMNGRKMAWPRGKVLGGSSSINGMVYIRGQKGDYDNWAANGCPGWSYDEVLPLFKRSENFSEGESEHHGVGGPLWVETVKEPFELAQIFIDAGVESGIPRNDDFNDGDNEGMGFYHLNTHKGLRKSSARSFLSLCKQRPNLDIQTHALTQKVLFEDDGKGGKRACGISYLQKGVQKIATAGAEVILCGGAVNSPQLLELSGIGQRERLEKLGIDVVSELPGVGENLQDHLTINIQQGLKNVNTFFEETRPLAMLGNLYKFLVKRKGLLTHPAAQAGSFFRADEQSDSADCQIHFAPAAGEYNSKGNMVTVAGTTATVCYLNPTSRGSIHIDSKDPQTYPKIHANYLDTDNDCQKLINAVRKTRDIFQTKIMAPYLEDEVLPGSAVQSDEQILAYIKDQSESVYHPVGTCKMGSDDMAVVDPQLRVRGVSDLRIADCSVIPTIPSGNTHAAAVMIAEKCNDMLLAERNK